MTTTWTQGPVSKTLDGGRIQVEYTELRRPGTTECEPRLRVTVKDPAGDYHFSISRHLSFSGRSYAHRTATAHARWELRTSKGASVRTEEVHAATAHAAIARLLTLATTEQFDVASLLQFHEAVHAGLSLRAAYRQL